MSDEELLEKNEDINRSEDKKIKAKTEEFNVIPQKIKENAIADALGGLDLV